MNLQEVKSLKRGDIVIDLVTGTKFRVMGIDLNDKFSPLEVALLDGVVDVIHTDTYDGKNAILEIPGDRTWLYLDEAKADEFSRDFQDPNWRLKWRLLTCELLEKLQ